MSTGESGEKKLGAREAQLFIIGYELEQLGFPCSADQLESLLDSEYVEGLLEGKESLEKEFHRLYLEDIQGRLRELAQPAVERKRMFVVRKRNMPAGVEFEDGNFVSSVTVGASDKVPVPPHADLDTHLQMRHLMTRHRDEVGNSDAPAALANLAAQLRGSAGATPTSDMEEVATPRKATAERLPGTPMTAPQTAVSGSDIVKLRDKFFARIALFSDFIETPRRDTKSESQLDAKAVRGLINSFKAETENPALNKGRQDVILAEVKAFAESLKTSPPKPDVSTPQPDRSLPQDVRATSDGRYFSVVNVFDELLQTPARGTLKEVMEDRGKFDHELKRVRSLISTSKSASMTAHKNTVLSSMSRFARSLIATPKPSDTPIHRLREKFYSTLDVLGHNLSTPVRSTESEVVVDKEIAQEVISAMHAAGKEAVVAEIRARWTNADKTPRKL